MTLSWERSLRFLAAALLWTVPAAAAQAESVLFDAKTEQSISALNIGKPTGARVEISQRYATRGGESMLISIPGAGTEKKPGQLRISMKPTVADWTTFQSFVLDIFNPGNNSTTLVMKFISPGGEDQQFFPLPKGRWRRIVIPISSIDMPTNAVSELRFVIPQMQGELELYLDNLVLLAQGEKAAPPSGAYLAEAASRLRLQITRKEEEFAGVRAGFTTSDDARIADWASEPALAEFREYKRLLDAPETSAEEIEGLGNHIDKTSRVLLTRLPSVVAFARECKRAGTLRDPDVLVGVATSMVKLPPRETKLDLLPASEIKLAAARNETESVQVAVLPLRGDLQQVSASADDLRSETGQVLSRKRIDFDVMGYVETKVRPFYDHQLIGWWPDPILHAIGPVNIARGDLQSFWVRVRMPKNQAPGLYRGELAVEGEGMNAVRIPFTVQVRSFAMPKWSPLPTAITFGPPGGPFGRIMGSKPSLAQWNSDLKFKWADFLADYYVTYDDLYRDKGPDFEIIDRLQSQGRLGAFNLGNCTVWEMMPGDPKYSDKEAGQAALRKKLTWIEDAYNEAKKRGLLGHAYIYGYDEVTDAAFAAAEETFAAVNVSMPGALTLTTAKDPSYGKNTVVKSVQAWCLPTDYSNDPSPATDARARGKKVWWYICSGPLHPYANMYIEYPAIEGRLLMGAMTAKYRPDGFLYYQLTLWQMTKPVGTDPFTEWNPQSWRTSHGDGSWVCTDKDGLPVPTIRLENYRDGLEDYAYIRLLEEAARIKESRKDALSDAERRWLAEAKNALNVPKELVTSLTEYSRDSARLYEWRARLASLIEGSGLNDLDPWGKEFHINGR